MPSVLVLSVVDGPNGDKIINYSPEEILYAFNHNTLVFVKFEVPSSTHSNGIAYNMLRVNLIEQYPLGEHDRILDFATEIDILLAFYGNECIFSTLTNGITYYPEVFTSDLNLYYHQEL